MCFFSGIGPGAGGGTHNAEHVVDDTLVLPEYRQDPAPRLVALELAPAVALANELRLVGLD